MNLEGIIKFIEAKIGIVLNSYNRHLLENRMAGILKDTRVGNVEELYVQLCVNKDPKIINYVINAVTVNETFWFRDKALWFMFEDLFLPRFVDQIKKGEKDKIKIWSAACSYGQEPYSLAMCIDYYLKKNSIVDVNRSHFQILATDISSNALEVAESAKYDNVSIGRGLNEQLKGQYFRHNENMWCLNNEIKDAVQFRKFNLVEDIYSLDQFDMILCRNVLIYFSEENKKEIYNNLAQSLKGDGVLFIGSSELLEDNGEQFSREMHTDGVYFKKID